MTFKILTILSKTGIEESSEVLDVVGEIVVGLLGSRTNYPGI